MSLLNDMLRDLSSGQNPAGSDLHPNSLHKNEQDSLELLRHSSVIKQEQGKLWPSIIIFCLVLILFSIWKWSSENQADHSNATGSQKIDTVLAVDQRATDVVQNNTDTPLAIGDEKSEVPAVSDSAELLSERLAALENAITRLSNVVEESQTPIAQENLAVQGDVSITRNFSDAPGTGESEIASTDQVAAAQPASVSIRDPFTVAPAAQNQSRTAIEADDHIPADAHLSIAPNAKFVDQRQAERGRQLLAQGQIADAIIELQSFIEKADVPRESAKALLDIFTVQENADAIESLLDTAPYLSSVDKHFYSAKAAVIRHREDYAVELLETHLTDAGVQEGYRAFLAGLYQRTGKYSEAANSYRRLLGNFGEKPAYWLGFALAQDSLNQPQVARQAYLRLAEYPDLQPQVRTYIQQRLAALQ